MKKKEKVRNIATHYRQKDKPLYDQVKKYAEERHITLEAAQLELVILGIEDIDSLLPLERKKSFWTKFLPRRYRRSNREI